MTNNNLEPRIVTVETELKSVTRDLGLLTKDVRELVQAVKTQGENFETQLHQVSVGLASAAGPRPVNWSVMLNAVGLIMVIAGAAFFPLNSQVDDLNKRIEAQINDFQSHEKLTLHPVGASKVEDLIKVEQINYVNLKEEIIALRALFDEVRREGSPATRERLSILEATLDKTKK